jgi:hypothetical protein
MIKMKERKYENLEEEKACRVVFYYYYAGCFYNAGICSMG